MNNLDLKKLTKTYILLAIGIIAVFCIPLFVYYLHFKTNSISNDPNDWGSLGDFISGSSGILLSCIAVIFSIYGIYNTTKISKYIFDNQIRPYPYLDLLKLPDITKITIQNMGLGPLIINKIKIRYAYKDEYNNFAELFNATSQIMTQEVEIILNSAPTHIIASNNSKSILKIIPAIENSSIFVHVQDSLRNILKDCVIEIEYEDIAQNKSKFVKDLRFFKK